MSSDIPYSHYRLTARLELDNEPGVFASVVSLLAREGASVGTVDLITATPKLVVRDVTFDAQSQSHGEAVSAKLRKLKKVRVLNVDDSVFLFHRGGKIRMQSKIPLENRNQLSMAYTPGVAKVCQTIAEKPESVYAYTIKANTVAIVSDGTAILGLGNLGPAAAIPVMEGKAMLFKEFAGIDAWPICLATQDPEEIIKAVQQLEPVFGAVNLEDISAPRCFEIEARLKETLKIPVMHDDQHGTAVVILAALRNALKLVKKDIKAIRVVVSGIGAAGVACCQILLTAGVRHLKAANRKGIVFDTDECGLAAAKQDIFGCIHRDRPSMPLVIALKGADVFIGVSVGNLLTAGDLKRMNKNRIVFAMANPDPEVNPESAVKICRVFATGRSDYPNQINNALAFPGIFRGALDVRATQINERMKLAAAAAIADLVPARELREDYIIPSIFDKRVVAAVAKAVAEAARKSGVGGRLVRRDTR